MTLPIQTLRARRIEVLALLGSNQEEIHRRQVANQELEKELEALTGLLDLPCYRDPPKVDVIEVGVLRPVSTEDAVRIRTEEAHQRRKQLTSLIRVTLREDIQAILGSMGATTTTSWVRNYLRNRGASEAMSDKYSQEILTHLRERKILERTERGKFYRTDPATWLAEDPRLLPAPTLEDLLFGEDGDTEADPTPVIPPVANPVSSDSTRIRREAGLKHIDAIYPGILDDLYSRFAQIDRQDLCEMLMGKGKTQASATRYASYLIRYLKEQGVLHQVGWGEYQFTSPKTWPEVFP